MTTIMLETSAVKANPEPSTTETFALLQLQ